MQKLSRGMPVFVIAMAVMFVVLIIFEWGDASQGGGGGGFINQRTALGSVNGDELDAVEFENRVAAATDNMRRQDPSADVDIDRIREAVWSQMIEEKLIAQAADRMGIRVSDDMLREQLLYNPPESLKQGFTDSTGFRQDYYFQFLSNPEGFMTQMGRSPQEAQKAREELVMLQEQMRSVLLREQVQSVVASTAILSPAEIRTAFDDQKSKVSGSYAFLPASVIPDSTIKISDAEAQKYYDEHKGDFQQKASREVRYILFPLEPSAQDSAATAKKLRNVLDQVGRAVGPAAKDSVFAQMASQYGSGQFTGKTYTPLQEIPPEIQNAISGAKPGDIIGPIRIQGSNVVIDVADVKDSGETFYRAQHILLRTDQGGNVDSLKKVAEGLMTRIKGGESFEAIAGQYSNDVSSAQRGGDVGYFKQGMMVPEFYEAASKAAVNSVVGPVKTQYGWHIIRTTDRSSKSYKLRDIRFDVQVTNRTENILRNRAQEARKRIDDGATIDTVAKMQKLNVVESGAIQRTQPIGGSMKLTYWAYDGKVGDVSDVITLPDRSLVIAQISKVHNEGLAEFSEVKEQIIAKLRLQKQLDMIKDRANKMRSSLAAGDSLSKLKGIEQMVDVQTFTDVTRNTSFPGVGYDPALTAAAFSMPLNQPSQPIRGDRGYFIMTVTNRTKPTDKEFETERATFTQQFTDARRQSLFQTWLDKERERADIEDNRDRF